MKTRTSALSSGLALLFLMAAGAPAAAAGWPRTVRTNPHPTSASAYFDSLQMVSTRVGWAWGWQGNEIAVLHTTDGGASWSRTIAPPFLQNQMLGSSLDFLNATTGWAGAIVAPSPMQQQLTDVVMYRTTDGGRSWIRTYLGKAPTVIQGGGIGAIEFLSPSRGWMLGLSQGAMGRENKTLFSTSDGGAAWKVVSSGNGYVPNAHPTPQALPEQGSIQLTFLAAHTGWAALSQALETPTYVALYRTVDGGANWSRVYVPVPSRLSHYYTLPQVPVFQGRLGTLVVGFGNGNGNGAYEVVTYRSENGGATWKVISELPGEQVVQAGFPTATDGVLFTSTHEEWLTTDGGLAWHRVSLSAWLQRLLDRQYSIMGLQMVTPSTGWLLLANLTQSSVQDYRSALLKTTDGGRTWQMEKIAPEALGTRE